jgi:hypothetical protein
VLLRLLIAPGVVVSTVALLGSGVALPVVGPGAAWLPSARLRLGIVALALLAGVALAGSTLHLARPWLDRVEPAHFDR